MTIRAPKPGEIPALLAMLTRAYVAERPGFPDDPSLLAAYSENDPGGGPENWVALWEDDRAVSALRLFFREVTAIGGTHRIGGIGNVGTDPDYAGCGMATRVMDAAHATLRRMGILTVALVTDIPDFYARMGYEPVQQRELLGVCARLDRSSAGLTSRPSVLGSAIPESVRRWHAECAGVAAGRVIRSEDYWKRWVARFKLRRPDVEGFLTAGAYLIGRSEENGAAYRVLEGGGDARDLTALAVDRGHGASRVKTPDEPLMREVMAKLNAQVSERTRTGIMALALAPGAPGPEALEGFLEIDAF